MQTQISKTRRIYLLVGAISIFFAGVIYAWSILKAPLAEAFGWSISALAVNFTFTFCCFCIGCLLASFLLKKLGLRNTLLLSALLVLAGFTMVAFMTGKSIAVLYVGYGIFMGMGIGIAYISIVSTVNAWFPDRPGESSGLMMMCFGVSSLVLGNLAAVIFGLGPDGWRWAYLGLGAAIFVSFTVGSLVLRMPGADTPLPTPKKKQKSGEIEPPEYTTGEMLRRKTFIMFYFYNFLTAAIGSSVFSFAKDYASFTGATPVLATMLVGLASICNGLGRISCGFVYDLCGRRFTMLLVNLLGIVATVILLLGSVNHSIALCIAGLCFAGVSYGSGSTISATFVGDFYGMKRYSMNLGIVTSAMIPASFMATVSSLMIAGSGGYVSTFIMLFCSGALAFGLNLAIKKP